MTTNPFTEYFVDFLDDSKRHTIDLGVFNGRQVDQLCEILFGDPRERFEVRLDGAKDNAIIEWYSSCRTVESKDLEDLKRWLKTRRLMSLRVYRVHTS